MACSGCSRTIRRSRTRRGPHGAMGPLQRRVHGQRRLAAAVYVRDARRMVSDIVMTEQHTRRINPVPVADPVAVAFWPTDTHSVRRIVRDGAAYNEGFVFDDNNWGPFGISYRALTPRRTEATNLLTPTCPSSSHVAYGAIRLEQTFMSLGTGGGYRGGAGVDGRRRGAGRRLLHLAQPPCARRPDRGSVAGSSKGRE